jgi:hypothetical protein
MGLKKMPSLGTNGSGRNTAKNLVATLTSFEYSKL